MKAIWFTGNGLDTGFIDVEIGQRATVFKCGSGRSVFGEGATLTGTTKQHLVFTTDSGATVKTKLHSLFCVVGKAAKGGFAVSLHAPESFENLIPQKVRFWNEKTLEFDIK